MLFATSGKVLANEQTYIVDLKSDISFYTQQQAGYYVVTQEELNELLQMDMIEYYEPNQEVKLLSQSWNLDMVSCDFAWNLGCFGNEVTIGVIDSGLYPFPELENNVVQGKNYLENSTDTTDYIGHGTFVTGIIASQSKGISYKSKIVPLKCFDINKTTYVSDILDAIYEAVDVYGCDVINMSIGVAGYSEKMKQAITYVTDRGCIVVAAVGNDGGPTMYYPASYENVVGVGSVNERKKRSNFSQYNESVFVTAPGEALDSLIVPDYINRSGTSFAAPHVTALASVAKCIDKDITIKQFMDLLEKSSTDLGAEGYDIYYGHGLINFEEFIRQMISKKRVVMFPVNKDQNSVYSVVYNNTNAAMTFDLICAEYNKGILYDYNVLPVTIPANGTCRFENPYTGNDLKYMLWQRLKNLIPLTEYRQLR